MTMTTTSGTNTTGMSGTVNWAVLTSVLTGPLRDFANEVLSARALYELAKGKKVGPEVRSLIRPGVDRARVLTRKALRRRNLL